jgi:hypothetical protein
MAIPAAGNFDASQILRLQRKADQIWADNMARQDYVARTGILSALRARQTAQLAELQDPMKSHTIRVMWLHACDIADQAVSDECNFSANELSSDYNDYTIDITRECNFAVKTRLDLRSDEFNEEEKIARGLLAADRELCEYFAQQCVSKLNTFAGTNTYNGPLGGTAWTNSAGSTEIPADQWNSTLMNSLSVAAYKQKFNAPFIVAGESLHYVIEEARQNRGNLDGAGDFVRMGLIDAAVDYVNIDLVNDPEYAAYMINTGAVAIVTKNYNPINPMVSQNPWTMHYRYASQNVPGLVFDAFMTEACSSREITKKWSIQLNAGIYLNPHGCTETNTGVLKFVRPTGI